MSTVARVGDEDDRVMAKQKCDFYPRDFGWTGDFKVLVIK